MRNITKILLLVLVGFLAYLLWPRSPSMKDFNPNEMAALQVRNWRAQKAGKGLDALMARFKIYSSQYHFSPISAFRIAQNQGAALEKLKNLKITEPDSGGGGGDDSAVLSAITEKYARIKTETKGNFDADAMARDEIAWRLFELNDSPVESVLTPLERILAGFYGGQPSDFSEVAKGLLTARAAVFKEPAPEGVDPLVTAREAYSLLKEIATAPPAPPAP